MILIIGYGALGKKVVNNLKDMDELVVIDKDYSRFESLDDVFFKYILGDATDPEVLKKCDVDKADTVIVLTNEHNTNREIVKLVREYNSDCYLIARGIIKYPNLYENLEVNKIIYPIDCATREIVGEVEKSKLLKKIKNLKNIVMSKINGTVNAEAIIINNENDKSKKNGKPKKFLIMTHKNPDPDSISSAMALQRILNSWGVDSDIAYGGKIGMDENKAMVNVLNIEMKYIGGDNEEETIDLEPYIGYAIVDTSSSTNLPINLEETDIDIDIVIDHHENGDLTGKFTDIRPKIGATATILTEYLKELNLLKDKDDKVATALYYGICSDTNYFRSEKSEKKDMEMAFYLKDYINRGLLKVIENPPMDTESVEALGRAIMNKQIVNNNILMSYVGTINNRDVLARIADFLLNMEGINTTYIYGIVGNKIYISGRTKDVRTNVGEIMKKAFNGGGHSSSAGAEIDLGIFGDVSDKEILRKLVEEAIKSKILSVMGY